MIRTTSKETTKIRGRRGMIQVAVARVRQRILDSVAPRKLAKKRAIGFSECRKLVAATLRGLHAYKTRQKNSKKNFVANPANWIGLEINCLDGQPRVIVQVDDDFILAKLAGKGRPMKIDREEVGVKWLSLYQIETVDKLVA